MLHVNEKYFVINKKYMVNYEKKIFDKNNNLKSVI